MLSTVLFEIGLEELPSSAVHHLANELLKNIEATCIKKGLSDAVFFNTSCFATPRRLAIRFKIPEMRAAQMIRRQGPSYAAGLDSTGQPTPALLGFSRACGVAWEALTVEQTEKGPWFVHETMIPPEPIDRLLPDILSEAVFHLPLNKPMRWGSNEDGFVRPVHWILCLLNHKVIDIHLFGCQSDRKTYGHRFHAPQAMSLSEPDEYESALRAAYVEVDFHQRKALIESQTIALASTVEGVASLSAELLEEVTSIVEWPVATLIPFDSVFIERAPTEALVAAMELHQKCFPIHDKKSHHLLPYCIAVANIASCQPSSVVEGNQRVIRARLNDAVFFYQQDQARGLMHCIEQTKAVIFQEKLGTLYQKTNRIKQIANPYLNAQDEPLYQRASVLCKADLMSTMVGEFPELEGIMGCYYAKAEGEDDAVATALKEYYYPRFSKDRLPQTTLGLWLSLADRLDTIVGIFSIGLKPTSVKDPFKLRRHAIAVLRILTVLRSNQPILLTDLLHHVAHIYQKEQAHHISISIIEEIHAFILDRLPAIYSQEDVPLAWIEAVKAVQKDDLFDFNARLNALKHLMHSPDHRLFLDMAKRLEGILQRVTSDHSIKEIQPLLFEKQVEIELYHWLKKNQIEYPMDQRLAPENYVHYLKNLLNSSSILDSFFSNVMVFVDDVDKRDNRLSLLWDLHKLFNRIFKISCFAV